MSRQKVEVGYAQENETGKGSQMTALWFHARGSFVLDNPNLLWGEHVVFYPDK